MIAPTGGRIVYPLDGRLYLVESYGKAPTLYQKWYHWELGLPGDNPELYARLSPLLQASKVTTPTLFLGDRDDWNVPILNAELFYQALKTRGLDTRLVVYPTTHHGGWTEGFNNDYRQRILAWFDHHLQQRR